MRTIVLLTLAACTFSAFAGTKPRACLVDLQPGFPISISDQRSTSERDLPLTAAALKKCKPHDILVLREPTSARSQQEYMENAATLGPGTYGNFYRVCDALAPIDFHSSYGGREAIICEYRG